MNKTFSTMQTNVGTEVQDTSTALKSIIKTYLNNRYFQVLRAVNWECIQPDYTFSTVAGQQDYALPEDFSKPIKVVDKTNSTDISEWDWQHVMMRYPADYDGSGTVERYSILEDTVYAQPTSASVLACKSSSASDTAITLLIRGISGGAEVNETVTLTGTSAANTTNSYTRVKSISKSGETVGLITVTSNSAAVTVATMSPEATTSYCKKIRLHYVPSSVVTIACPYIIKPSPMVEDYDYPAIDISDLLELGAKADTWRYKRQYSKASAFDVQFTIALADYVWEKENKGNSIPQFRPDTSYKDISY